jgi:hypothetical protein
MDMFHVLWPRRRAVCTPASHRDAVRLGEIEGVEWLHCRECGRIWTKGDRTEGDRMHRRRQDGEVARVATLCALPSPTAQRPSPFDNGPQA